MADERTRRECGERWGAETDRRGVSLSLLRAGLSADERRDDSQVAPQRRDPAVQGSENRRRLMRTHAMRSTSRISPLFCVVCVGAGSCRRPGARLRRVRVRRHAGPTTGAHAPCILKEEKMCSAHGVFFSRRKRSTTFVRCVPVSAPYLGPYRIARRRTVSLRIGICGYRPATSTARAVGAPSGSRSRRILTV